MALIKFSAPPQTGGAFLLPCIDTVQGFYFCPITYQPRTSVYSGLYSIHAIYTAITSKAFTGLYNGVSVDLPHFSAHNTATAQAAYTQPAPRRRAYRQALHLRRCKIPPTRRTLYRAGQPPIIIRYIRVRPCYRSMPAGTA